MPNYSEEEISFKILSTDWEIKQFKHIDYMVFALTERQEILFWHATGDMLYLQVKLLDNDEIISIHYTHIDENSMEIWLDTLKYNKNG